MMRGWLGPSREPGQLSIRIYDGRERIGQAFSLNRAGSRMTVGMESLGEGAKGSTQLMAGKALTQVDSTQTLKSAERISLYRCEAVGPCGAGGRIAAAMFDRKVPRMRPVRPLARAEPIR